MNIDEMQAGRKLDALIAKKVLGWRQEYTRRIDGGVDPIWKEPEYLVPLWGDEAQKIPLFSTDIKAAWQVVEWLLEYGFPFELTWVGIRHGWCCWFGSRAVASASVRQPALAICRAALKTVADAT